MELPTLSKLTRNIEIADELHARRGTTFEPQDLPDPFGRVVRAVDKILYTKNIPAVVCGDWAVWRYGYPRRISDDLDIILPRAPVAEFMVSARAFGFDDATSGRRWPRLTHCETQLQVDILPESLSPGLGGEPGRLRFIDLPSLLVMKLAADRTRDRSDVVDLLLTNPKQVAQLRAHAAVVNPRYAALFDQLAESAAAQCDS